MSADDSARVAWEWIVYEWGSAASNFASYCSGAEGCILQVSRCYLFCLTITRITSIRVLSLGKEVSVNQRGERLADINNHAGHDVQGVMESWWIFLGPVRVGSAVEARAMGAIDSTARFTVLWYLELPRIQCCQGKCKQVMLDTSCSCIMHVNIRRQIVFCSFLGEIYQFRPKTSLMYRD